jgi:Uma2 family endonuclease
MSQLTATPGLVLDFSALDRLPDSTDLPCSDGEPLETWWQRPAIALLVESIEYHWRDRKDFFVGGNMFVYFSRERVFNKDFRGPDFFVVRGADHSKPRQSWVYWDEEGRHPNVVIELLSESTAHIDRGEKKQVYAEKMRVPEYFIYDPDDGSLTGWRMSGSRYKDPLDPEPGGRLWSEELELFVGPWEGDYRGHHDRWLRFFDADGRVISTFAEAARAEAAAAQTQARAAEAEVARLTAELAALRNQPPHP